LSVISIEDLRFSKVVEWEKRGKAERETLHRGRNPAVEPLPHHCPMELTDCYVVLQFGT
jgi:hypothetical protein